MPYDTEGQPGPKDGKEGGQRGTMYRRHAGFLHYSAYNPKRKLLTMLCLTQASLFHRQSEAERGPEEGNAPRKAIWILDHRIRT